MGYLEKLEREDGLIVFLEGDNLDDIKKEGSREDVIMTVAYNVARKIALNYCERYANDLYGDIKEKLPDATNLASAKRSLFKSFDF